MPVAVPGGTPLLRSEMGVRQGIDEWLTSRARRAEIKRKRESARALSVLVFVRDAQHANHGRSCSAEVDVSVRVVVCVW